MPSLTLTISYRKNTGLVLSASEFINLFFFGTPPIDINGDIMSDEAINFYIESAQLMVEHDLSIKLIRQSLMENPDYSYDDWREWGYTPTVYPVEKALSLNGYINTSLQVTYPVEWLSAKRRTEKDLYHRNVSLVPVAGSIGSITGSTVFVGIVPYIGWFGSKQVPNYWSLVYITGFQKVPKVILEAIGKIAAISVFAILGDAVLGVGVASKSLSIDGLSQSVNTTASAMYSAFSARIGQYEKDLEKRIWPSLKGRYQSILFGVL